MDASGSLPILLEAALDDDSDIAVRCFYLLSTLNTTSESIKRFK